METSAFINNAALLLALSILSTYLRYRWFKEFRVKELVLGVHLWAVHNYSHVHADDPDARRVF